MDFIAWFRLKLSSLIKGVSGKTHQDVKIADSCSKLASYSLSLSPNPAISERRQWADANLTKDHVVAEAPICTKKRCFGVYHLHSLKLTRPLKLCIPKRKRDFQPSIFKVYLSFRKGSSTPHAILWPQQKSVGVNSPKGDLQLFCCEPPPTTCCDPLLVISTRWAPTSSRWSYAIGRGIAPITYFQGHL